ncbi:MAG: DUF2281 domain-containing protein [Clostridiales bacterium]|nr:DUF2281 domain-containing protein [Clostridiales bacterium]
MIYDLLDALPDSQISEMASFIMSIKMRDKGRLHKDLEAASLASADFWDNDIGDEVWNNT